MTANDQIAETVMIAVIATTAMTEIESIEMIEVIMTGMTAIGIATNDAVVIREEEDVTIETVVEIEDELAICNKDSLSIWNRKKRTNHQRLRLEDPLRAHRGIDDDRIEVVVMPMHQEVVGESSTGRSSFKMV